jgi:hypothetical protein
VQRGRVNPRQNSLYGQRRSVQLYGFSARSRAKAAHPRSQPGSKVIALVSVDAERAYGGGEVGV